MNKDKQAKDKTRNNIFAAAFDYLKRTTDINTQQELADKMGVTKDTVSRIITAKTKVTDDAITKLQTASGCIFNLQWLRGESDVMLAADADQAPVANNLHESTHIDQGSLVNATIAAQQTSIESLKREVAAKDETIGSLKREGATKDELIKSLQQQVAELRAALAEQQKKDFLGNYPFTIGAADDQEQQGVAVK
jgi:plasmid maintenance system antidote protein VapI